MDEFRDLLARDPLLRLERSLFNRFFHGAHAIAAAFEALENSLVPANKGGAQGSV